MTEKEIQQLLHQIALTADQQAFRQLFRHFAPPLSQFARSFIKDREAAEEIVEDVFVAIWRKREQLTEIAGIRVYLYVTTRNLCINYLNRSKRVFTDLDQLDVTCASLVPTPEDVMLAAEMNRAINAAVQELPPKCRIIYKLVKEDGLKYKEVAEILGISDRTVETHIGTALKKIAAAIRLDFKTVHTLIPGNAEKK